MSLTCLIFTALLCHDGGVTRGGSTRSLSAVLARSKLPRRLRKLPPTIVEMAARRDDAEAVQALLQGASSDLRACVTRLRARGADLPELAAFCDRWERLDETARGQVARPFDADTVAWGTTPARQYSQVACGYAVAAMHSAYLNPRVAMWLASGGGRFAELQDHIGARIRRAAVGPLRWPARFGSPPWTLARELSWPGARYRSVLIDSDRHIEGATERVRAQIELEVPIPIYVGGTRVEGMTRSVPRHVVLATPGPAGMRVYEPSSARMFDLGFDQLFNSAGARPEFGGWSIIHAILFAVARR